MNPTEWNLIGFRNISNKNDLYDFMTLTPDNIREILLDKFDAVAPMLNSSKYYTLVSGDNANRVLNILNVNKINNSFFIIPFSGISPNV